MRGMRAAAKSRRSVKGYGILASPADAGERSTSANHTSFYSCSWDVFPYDLFPVQLCPMGLLLGQVSKWRAQRADRGAHAARGFVGGAAGFSAGYCGWRSEVSMPHAALWVVQRSGISKKLKPVCFNAARGFVGGAAGKRIASDTPNSEFQCRTRLCGWCNNQSREVTPVNELFQCRTRLCGWCNLGGRFARGR